MKNNKKIAAYKSAAVENLSPEKIILLLFDSALSCIDKAKFVIQNDSSYKKFAKINDLLQKAKNIFIELQDALDPTHNKEFVEKMYPLYSYVNELLQKANLEKTVEPLNEVKDLIAPIRDAWRGALDKKHEVKDPQLLACEK